MHWLSNKRAIGICNSIAPACRRAGVAWLTGVLGTSRAGMTAAAQSSSGLSACSSTLDLLSLNSASSPGCVSTLWYWPRPSLRGILWGAASGLMALKAGS